MKLGKKLMFNHFKLGSKLQPMNKIGQRLEDKTFREQIHHGFLDDVNNKKVKGQLEK